ncbi:MAG: TIGR02221 family CRISPR-associated protein [Chloroflexota bacterium]|nr:TIGR02221 family CRISPR-associated protein [Chloroflexota bacterium]
MKLLSFIGTTCYYPTTYVWSQDEGRLEHTSPFCPVATAHFVQAEKVLVFATDEAEEKHGEDLRRELEPAIELQIVNIPDGSSTRELWDIFSLVAQRVTPSEHVAFDVTHGFRSLPLVGLLIAAFLRVARDVNVERILYGAWEARDEGTDPPTTPIFDLTPMFVLLEWAIASDHLVRFGDARDLAQLVREAQPPYAQRQENPSLYAQGKKLGLLSKYLRETSRALRLIRPHTVMETARDLERSLDEARDRYPYEARPFEEILGRVKATFAGFALDDAAAPENAAASLERQHRLIHWYLEHEHYPQAATLAREWLVSWGMLQEGHGDLTDRDLRGKVNDEIGRCWGEYKKGRRPRPTFLENVPPEVDFVQMWGELSDLRNDINHAGMNKNPMKPDTLVKKINDLVCRIDCLPLPDEPGV